MQRPVFNISDRHGFKRQVEILYLQPAWYVDQVILGTLCRWYKDEYITEINELGLRAFERQLVASNIRQVDPTDGMLVIEDKTDPENVVWKRADNQQAVEFHVGQADYFDSLIQAGPVDIIQVIGNVIQIEDQMFHSWDS